VQVGGERYNLFTDCPQARTATIVLRGGSEQFIDEAERSLHDAIMIVRRALKHAHVVAGGGAIDMEVGHSTVQRSAARCLGLCMKCRYGWLTASAGFTAYM
jgi:chaperonin GroEL (HSP60 family)